MSLLDDHKGSMDDGAYLALSNGLKTAHEAEERSARLVEVSYVQLDSHVDRDENEAVIRGAVRKMIAEETFESPPDVDTRHMNSNLMAKSAEWLSIGKDKLGDVCSTATTHSPIGEFDTGIITRVAN